MKLYKLQYGSMCVCKCEVCVCFVSLNLCTVRVCLWLMHIYFTVALISIRGGFAGLSLEIGVL